jgi:Fe-S oxidoreductase
VIATTVSESAKKYGVSSCIDCGKCTWGCPVSHKAGDFSPRKVVEDFVASGHLSRDKGLWECMTCGMCTELCTSGVEFHEFVREVRPSLKNSLLPETTHSDIFQIIQNLTSFDFVEPRTDKWIMPDLKVDKDSSTLLFVGCTPYFDVIFNHIRTDLLEIPRSSLRLLNHMGIQPRILEHERCCGHDAYWLGDDETFRRLAEANLRAIEAAGVDEVVAFCPECYTALKHVYPRVFGPLGFEVKSLTAMVGEAVQEGRISLRGSGDTLTYHDPCRLTRHSGIVREPRSILNGIGRLVEMPRSGILSACCGTACWVNCDASTKGWQLGRLEEAAATGAAGLVTACPKCLIHLSCALHEHSSEGPECTMPISDMHVLASRCIQNL